MLSSHMETYGTKNISVMYLPDRHPQKIPPFCVHICIDARVDLRVDAHTCAWRPAANLKLLSLRGHLHFGGTVSHCVLQLADEA